MTSRSRRLRLPWLLGLALLAAGPPARADITWTVNLDTSQLATQFTGPFALDFELVGTSGNTVTLSRFAFGGGAAGPGGPFRTGAASGSLGSSVALSDNATTFFSDFNQQFTPGGTLSFTVDSTAVAPPSGGTPDNFSLVLFSAYDPVNGYDPLTGMGGTPIPTGDPTGADTLLTLDVNGPGATTLVGYAGGAGGNIGVIVTPTSVVPEPSSGAMMFVGLLGLAGAHFRRARGALRERPGG